jgi:hypothetical protein
MAQDLDQAGTTRSGLAGVLKLIGIVAIVLLALLGVLVVLDVIPRTHSGSLPPRSCWLPAFSGSPAWRSVS